MKEEKKDSEENEIMKICDDNEKWIILMNDEENM